MTPIGGQNVSNADISACTESLQRVGAHGICSLANAIINLQLQRNISILTSEEEEDEIPAGPDLRVAKHGHKLGRFHMAVEEVVSAPLNSIQCLLKLTHLDNDIVASWSLLQQSTLDGDVLRANALMLRGEIVAGILPPS